MNVKEFIEQLNQIEDKSKDVKMIFHNDQDFDGEYFIEESDMLYVTETKNGVELSEKKAADKNEKREF